MSRSSRTLLYILGVFFAVTASAFAQTYDLPIIFVDTKQKCLDKNVTEKIPATMKSSAQNSFACLSRTLCLLC